MKLTPRGSSHHRRRSSRAAAVLSRTVAAMTQQEHKKMKAGDAVHEAGWRPEPYPPREASWADSSPHAKISNYIVVRNDENAYSWQIQLHVTGKEYENVWRGGEEEILVTVEDGCLVLRNHDEKVGAYLKLPKYIDPKAKPIVDRPKADGMYVTMSKVGAKAAPEPLSDTLLLKAPRIFKDHAPSVEEELKRIGEEQAARKKAIKGA